MHQKEKTFFLDTLRGFAAFYVVMHHARWLLAEGFSNRLKVNFNGSLVSKMVANAMSIFKFGHQMVILFFVLSGFVIHYSVLRTVEKKGVINWKDYFIKRFNRIYPPFLFALILVLSIDYIGYGILHLPFYLNGSTYFSFKIGSGNTSILNFIGNLFNLQTVVREISPLGSNKPLWSLSYEWWFYILYPLFYFLHRKNIFIPLLLQLVLFLLFQIIFPNYYIPVLSAIFSKMCIWWLGVFLAELYFTNKRNTIKYFIAFIILIPVSIKYFENNALSELCWGLGFLGLMSYCLNAATDNKLLVGLNKLHFLGDGSYTVYLIHLPVFTLIHAYLMLHFNGKLPDSYIWLLTTSILVILLGRFIARWVEQLRLIKH